MGIEARLWIQMCPMCSAHALHSLPRCCQIPEVQAAHALLQCPKQGTEHGERLLLLSPGQIKDTHYQREDRCLAAERGSGRQLATRVENVYLCKDLLVFCSILHSANTVHIDFSLLSWQWC